MASMLFDDIIDLKTKYKEIPAFDPDGEYSGIKAITYDAAKINGYKTKAFAYIGFPCDALKPVPAVVLVHGGGGVAYLEWVKMWNERGYAAIAMSTTGDFPTVKLAGETEASNQKERWHHGLYGDFVEEGYVDAPYNYEMNDSDKPLCEQWMYNAVSQIIAAHNILRDNPEVDSERIGICGVSWGGVLTSVTIGYDKRFAFAIPIYGSGYILESMGSLGDFFRNNNVPNEWLAEKRFPEVCTPTLWLCWNSDTPFSLNSNAKSYMDTVKNSPKTRISIVHEMGHSHKRAWVRKEPFVFADSICKSAPEMPSCFVNESMLVINNHNDLNIVSKKLYYINEPLSYTCKDGKYSMNQEWNIKEITDGFDFGVIRFPYYIELTFESDGKQYISSSSFIEKI